MKLLNALIKHLGLQKPVTVTIKTRYNPEAEALYNAHYSDRTGKLLGHKVVIYSHVDNTRDFDTLLAHELIHAKQEEMRLQEIHGPVFKQWAADLETNFGLQEIFIYDVDTN